MIVEVGVEVRCIYLIRGEFQTFPVGGWVGVENEINAYSAFNEVEVEAELGKNSSMTTIQYNYNDKLEQSWCFL